ncbi:MAG: hypothetical protein J0H14_10590 [Alphaproteobacteria bacterium]|nr:hypothetical protein [Alphaproteobacteria bacterium]
MNTFPFMAGEAASGLATPYRHDRRRAVIHDFSAGKQSRGWPACADHDEYFAKHWYGGGAAGFRQ